MAHHSKPAQAKFIKSILKKKSSQEKGVVEWLKV
jgi:hypothetical protein